MYVEQMSKCVLLQHLLLISIQYSKFLILYSMPSLSSNSYIISQCFLEYSHLDFKLVLKVEKLMNCPVGPRSGFNC